MTAPIYKADRDAADRLLRAACRESIKLIRASADPQAVRNTLGDATRAAGLLIDEREVAA